MNELFGLLWVVGPPLIYGAVLRAKFGSFQKHQRDPRSRRDLIAAIAFFVAAWAAATSILVVLLPSDNMVRRVFAGIAWATFAAAGIVWLQEIRQEDNE